MQKWFVYIIEASDGSLYTGISTDVERRFSEHCGQTRGAKYFRGRTPRKVVYTECHPDRSSAQQREAMIKKLGRGKKMNLVGSSE